MTLSDKCSGQVNDMEAADPIYRCGGVTVDQLFGSPADVGARAAPDVCV